MIGLIRGYDSQGAGHYGASRGSRIHVGIDFVTEKDQEVKSLCKGVVTKIGYPYSPEDKQKGHLRYIQVTDKRGFNTRYFYVFPEVNVGDVVLKGEVIGISQNLTKIYRGITQHFHFEVKRKGEFVNPHHYLEGRL